MDGRAGVWTDKGGGTNVCEPSLKQLILYFVFDDFETKIIFRKQVFDTQVVSPLQSFWAQNIL